MEFPGRLVIERRDGSREDVTEKMELHWEGGRLLVEFQGTTEYAPAVVLDSGDVLRWEYEVEVRNA